MNDGREGKIVTFYSFKGGVGRTMALANVAFVAASNGMRVLVMDWDLEAPGLAYYFRGLLDGRAVRSMKNAPGVLDLMWEWKAHLEDEEQPGPDNPNSLFSRYNSGQAFRACVRPIVDASRLPSGGFLDIIGPGRPQMVDKGATSYEEALALFSWPVFFEKYAGGSVIERLRAWAKGSYDLVLVDSRTGLADVAGVCTMLLPDVLVLCFVYNRQNIDGIARVASAVHARRQSAVEIRAAPMRVARENTAEEADAKARALRELSTVGGISLSSLNSDFELLAIKASAAVPFYETLAPFSAPDPSLDVLTLNYVSMAGQICGRSFEVRGLDRSLIGQVRSRLESRTATIEYIEGLAEAEEARRVSELRTLIQNAWDVEVNGEGLESDYVSALSRAAFEYAEFEFDNHEASELIELLVGLMRNLFSGDPDIWGAPFAKVIERYAEYLSTSTIDQEEQYRKILEELDVVLASFPRSVETDIRRLVHRRTIAQAYLVDGQHDIARKVALDGRKMLDDTHRVFAVDRQTYLQFDVGFYLILGDVSAAMEVWLQAIEDYQHGVGSVGQALPTDCDDQVRRLVCQLHIRLAKVLADPKIVRKPDLPKAVDHVMAACGWAPSSRSLASNFVPLANLLLRHKESEKIVAFCSKTLESQEGRSSPLIYDVAKSPNHLGEFLECVVRLVGVLGESRSSARTKARLQMLLVDAAGIAWLHFFRRSSRRLPGLSTRQRKSLRAKIDLLIDVAVDIEGRGREILLKARESLASPDGKGDGSA